MIGYLVKGPVSIDPENLPVSLKVAVEMVEKVDRVFRKINREKLKLDDLGAEEKAVIKHFDISSYTDHDGEINCEHLITGQQNAESPERFVYRFIHFWNNPEIYQDSISQIDPDDLSRKIIFAGDAADAGNGYGFNMLFDAEIHGLFPVFGIR
jgi:hypothetical protein